MLSSAVMQHSTYFHQTFLISIPFRSCIFPSSYTPYTIPDHLDFMQCNVGTSVTPQSTMLKRGNFSYDYNTEQCNNDLIVPAVFHHKLSQVKDTVPRVHVYRYVVLRKQVYTLSPFS